jgi:hypothetical protein
MASIGHLSAQAQHLLIVDESNGKTVQHATVVIDGNQVDVDSSHAIDLPPSAHTLMARAVGYWPYQADVASLRDKTSIALRPLAVHALYLTEYGVASKVLRDAALAIIQRGAANALVITIKSDRGNLAYPSTIPLAAAIGARKVTTVRSLPALVEELHAKHIYLIARIVTFKDDPLAESHPELGVHTGAGALYKDRERLAWTDPFQRQVRDYNISVAVEAARAGFDEVQFDYVRFPDCPQRLRFSASADERSRISAISGFLTDARRALMPFNVFLSVDIFGYVAWNTNDTGIGQHLEEITAAVDYVCPMLYPSGFRFGVPGHPNAMTTDADIYNTVRLSLDNCIRRTQADPKKFRPWIQGFRDYAFARRVFGPGEVALQIRAVSDARAGGWSLWNARNVYTGAGLP